MAPPSSPGPGPKKAKLPVHQLAILSIARFCEPVALMSIFPYLPEMIQSFGIPKHEVAKWAGIITGTFAVSQSLTAVAWGQASDRWGRKPTILMGLVFSLLCFLVWGFATDLKTAIVIRFIQGASNGNVGIIRTMVAEMVTEKELQPRAFSIMPLVWSIGSIFGPAFGGFFAKPAQRFPDFFGHSKLLQNYPFALPNLIAAAFFLISITTGVLFLKETLDHKRHQDDWGILIGKRLTNSLRLRGSNGAFRRASFVDGEATAPLIPSRVLTKPHRRSPPKAGIAECFTRQSTIALIAYMGLAVHSMAYDQIIPVFLNMAVDDHTGPETQLPFKFIGGFGWESDKIGTVFTIYGLMCSLVQFIIFPPLCNYIGVRNCFRTCVFVMPLAYFLTPFTVLISDPTIRTGALLAVMSLKAFGIILAFPCVIILLTNSASSVRILGTLNGVATTVSAIGRAVGPAVTGWIFSRGVVAGYIIAPWWFLTLISIAVIIPSWMLEDGEGPSALADEENDNSSVDDSENAIEDDDDCETIYAEPTSKTPLLANGSSERVDYKTNASSSSSASSLAPAPLSQGQRQAQ
ncbi:hypothetical protein Cpir12675_002126 [Ceratocystis pirilliformis]|uniref:Major facilitator superfamily (MFS) profile domain-containing protein n=1 Tax=Ceratocystis pirilliformis TaxID=259994 RepID=A0ABR3ZES5_9PEZI